MSDPIQKAFIGYMDTIEDIFQVTVQDTFAAGYASRDAEVKRLREALEFVSNHYSGSLDHQPTFVSIVRKALEDSSD